jgi:hypothetical protein
LNRLPLATAGINAANLLAGKSVVTLPTTALGAATLYQRS